MKWPSSTLKFLEGTTSPSSCGRESGPRRSGRVSFRHIDADGDLILLCRVYDGERVLFAEADTSPSVFSAATWMFGRIIALSLPMSELETCEPFEPAMLAASPPDLPCRESWLPAQVEEHTLVRRASVVTVGNWVGSGTSPRLEVLSASHSRGSTILQT